jgi:hypothetical protein
VFSKLTRACFMTTPRTTAPAEIKKVKTPLLVYLYGEDYGLKLTTTGINNLIKIANSTEAIIIRCLINSMVSIKLCVTA